LQELDFGAWEGQPWAAVPRIDLDRWAASPLTFAPPGGESGADLIRRVRAVCAAITDDRRNCLIVSHGGPLKILLALLRARDPDLLAPAPPLGSVTVVSLAMEGSYLGPKTQRRNPGDDALAER
jgi:alpha-ribazole phosphatase